MGELRRDYFRERYVIISPERAKRPDDFSHPAQPSTGISPFAPGNEKAIPKILAEFPKGEQWQFRVVPNKFAVVRAEGNPTVQTAHELFSWSNNYGEHEIVIEGREDNVPFHALGPEGISQAIAIAIDRIKRMQSKDNIKHVAYFKNEGKDAGASINHPHSQLISMAIIPPSIQELTTIYNDKRVQWGFSPLYKVLDHERNGPRIVAETVHFVALCPYASRFPMELLLIPLKDEPSYTTITEDARRDLAHLLHKLLGRLASISTPYNIEWFHATDSAFHWHLRVTPRLTTWAGYELETNVIVNPIPPEHAAVFYRGEA